LTSKRIRKMKTKMVKRNGEVTPQVLRGPQEAHRLYDPAMYV
jgi:hypothetical protein